MPTRIERDDINDMPSEPSPYGDQIVKAVMLLMGIAAFVVLVLHR